MFSLSLLQNGIAIMELAATALNPYKPEAVESGTSVNQIRCGKGCPLQRY
jgi:hypothetical protein